MLSLLNAARSGLGPLLSAFEVMWPDYWDVITARAGVRSPVGTGHGLYVLVEAQGTDEATDAPRFEGAIHDRQFYRCITHGCRIYALARNARARRR